MNSGDAMKYLLQGNFINGTRYIVCDFTQQTSSLWQPTKELALTTSSVGMGKYWTTARTFKTEIDLETYLTKYYTKVERISDKPQPYEFW